MEYTISLMGGLERIVSLLSSHGIHEPSGSCNQNQGDKYPEGGSKKLFYFPSDLQCQRRRAELLTNSLLKSWPSLSDESKDFIDQAINNFLDHTKIVDNRVRFDHLTEFSLFTASLLGKKKLVEDFRDSASSLIYTVFKLRKSDKSKKVQVSLVSGEVLEMSMSEAINFSFEKSDLVVKNCTKPRIRKGSKVSSVS
jgi:hypothetical protein